MTDADAAAPDGAADHRDPLRVAVVGAGFISDYHLDGLKAAGGARVTVLVGRRPEPSEARARAHGVPHASTDLDAVLADPAVDALVVATPDATHHDIAIRALEAGKSVLLQKPMALTSAECRAILAAAARSTGRLSVSFMHRHFPEVRWLRGLLGEGALGAVHTVRLRNATPGADWADWFYAPANVSGGVVMQLGVHGIDLVGHLFGPVTALSGQAVTAQPQRALKDGRVVEMTLEDNVTAHYRLESGTLVSHEMSYTEAAGCDRFRLEVYAERGTVWLRTERGLAAIFAPDVTGEPGWVTPDLPEEPLGLDHHRDWIATVRDAARPDDTGEAGLATIVVAETLYAAIREARWRDVPHEEAGERR